MANLVGSRQLRSGRVAAASGALAALLSLGVDLQPVATRARAMRTRHATAVPSICPYCAVGCDTVVYVTDGKITDIEGDVRSPVNHGNLCPKGAATYQLHVNPHRATKALHRKPGATDWEEMDLDAAMHRVAELVKETRDRTFVEQTDDGKTLMATTSIFSLGGATMDNEWNHLQQKLFRGLGLPAIENQARI